MAKKKKPGKKKGKALNFRKITTWSSVFIFMLLAGIIATTAWFVWSTMNTSTSPNALLAEESTDVPETINTRLIKTVSQRLKDKINRSITVSDSLRNPFMTRENQFAPPPPPEPPPEPEPDVIEEPEPAVEPETPAEESVTEPEPVTPIPEPEPEEPPAPSAPEPMPPAQS